MRKANRARKEFKYAGKKISVSIRAVWATVVPSLLVNKKAIPPYTVA